jgi:hypothetical protein
MLSNEATGMRIREDWPFAIGRVNVWLHRGDGVAMYENMELGHPDLGSTKITSWGSSAAQLEPFCGVCRGVLEPTETPGEFVHGDGEPDHFPVYPPQRLPDIGDQINFRFVLIGTYRGEEL